MSLTQASRDFSSSRFKAIITLARANASDRSTVCSTSIVKVVHLHCVRHFLAPLLLPSCLPRRRPWPRGSAAKPPPP
eukprot:6846340-Prorocentrum_lima.AAC.1